MMEPVLAEL